MGLRGDFAGLRGLISRLRQLGDKKLARKEGALMQDALAVAREEIASCFLYQRAPDGEEWLARITIYGDFRDTNPLLFDLLSYMRFEAADGRIRVTNTKPYAFFHLHAYKRRPARPFLPTRASPGRLYERLQIIAVRAVRGLLRG